VTGEEILKHLGYGVTLAEDGEEGLEYYRSHWRSIDLVILDMIMPRMNGGDCYTAMREINPRIRAILTSGFTTAEDVRRLKEEGLAYFCRKPYTIAQLGSIIEEAMKQE
jgi:two-component system, cell cycle sensor histidine kinase and response regulator CckA